MLGELCRLCGNKSDSTLDIFSESGARVNLEVKIRQVVRLDILQEDPLPNVVCNLCVRHLENASHFIDHCHQTQKYLNQLYVDNTSPLDQIVSAFVESYSYENDDKFHTEIDLNPSTTSDPICDSNTETKNLDGVISEQTDGKIQKNNDYSEEALRNYVKNLSNALSSKLQDNSSLPIEPNLPNRESEDENRSIQSSQSNSDRNSSIVKQCTRRILEDHGKSADEALRNYIKTLLYAADTKLQNNSGSSKDEIHSKNNVIPPKSNPFDNLNLKRLRRNNLDRTLNARQSARRILKDHDNADEALRSYIKALSNASSNNSRDTNSGSSIEPNSSSVTENKENPSDGKELSEEQLPFDELSSKTCQVTSNGTCNETSSEIPRLKPENKETNNRSQLKRKCTLQITPIGDRNESSDEDIREVDVHSDDSFVFISDEDEEYDISKQNTKNNYKKSNPVPISNRKNSPRKDTSKCSSLEGLLVSGGSKQSTKENESNRKETKSKKPFQCATCEQTFSQELTYEEHLNLHTGNRPFSCKLCTASFRRRQDLNQHLRTIHSENQFKCPSCDHVAKHKGKLTEHIKSVHDKPFACDLCNYRTGEKGKIMQHIANKHTDDLSFVCEICGNGFKTKNSLQVHIRNIHHPEPKVCQLCGTVCPSLAKYSSHVFRCGKEKKRHSCEKCGKSYVNKEILRDHMNKHFNVKPYKCEVCGKAFYLRNRLHTHKYVHRGANYQCEICNQSFNRKDNMKNHMKRHFYKSIRCDDTIVTAV